MIEIFKHKERILKTSKSGETELLELLEILLHRIKFINEEFIPTGNIIHAYKLCRDVDEKDTIFVALTLELEGLLFTFDEEHKSGL